MPEQDKVTYDGLSAVRAFRPGVLVAGLVATLLIVGVLFMTLTRGSVRAEPQATATISPTITPVPTATPTPRNPVTASIPEGGDDDEVAPSSVAAVTAPVAARFTDAWLRKEPEASRLATLRPVSTLALAQALAKVDPNRLPEAVRRGAPEVLAAGTFDVRIRQGLSDRTSIVLDLVPEVSAAGTRWVVASVRPGEAG